eukprot:8297865-Pyramimonas_sp.AAC.1
MGSFGILKIFSKRPTRPIRIWNPGGVLGVPEPTRGVDLLRGTYRHAEDVKGGPEDTVILMKTTWRAPRAPVERRQE